MKWRRRWSISCIEERVTDGQEMAAELKYAKLSPEAQKLVLEKLQSITFDGKPLLK